MPASAVCHSLDEAVEFAATVGNRVVIRPSFTMGGLGSGMAHTAEEVRVQVARGLAASPVTEVLVEESVFGWKEFELELMRDRKDNVVVVCSIENIDPMGVHTGDSITVAPAMTLTDREYQRMRDIGIAVLREVGVDTGGCNIQFAVDPRTGRLIVIEMNPRVSRSSALASKATGFPIAKIAAKLAVGYTLDEVSQRHHPGHPGLLRAGAGLRGGQDPPVRVREVPGRRPGADHPHEVGRRGDVDRPQLHRGARQGDAVDGDQGRPGSGPRTRPMETCLRSTSCSGIASVATDGRLYAVERAMRAGATVDEVAAATGIDAWFVDQFAQILEVGQSSSRGRGADPGAAAHGKAARPVGPADRRAAAGAGRRGRGAPAAAPGRHPAGVQDRRHLRGRVRRQHPVPLLQLRLRDRGGRRSRTGRRC